MTKKGYDFAGWVTKNDIRCSDGVTIKHDAFKQNDGQKVPLVWNHDYKSPNNVLGHVLLQNAEQGVYGYGYFNDSPDAVSAKEMVRHGDISSMSIGARKIKRSGNDVIHGLIYEVSLVMAAANPGATIETVMTHSDDGEEEHSIITTGTLIHSSDDVLEHKEEEKKVAEKDERTLGDIIDTMNDEQKEAVYALVGMAAEGDDQEDKGADEEVKQNVFQGKETNQNDILKHGANEALQYAMQNKLSLKDTLAAYEVKGDNDEVLTHGINSIEMLFPEAAQSSNGNVPILYKDPNTAYKEILNGTTKSPFSRIKTLVADITEEEARAKGYIKGNMKKEEFFSLIKRTTEPTTVYKKQKLDRDDIIDITDFDVVSFMNSEMRIMLEEEIARAILVGDGREIDSEDKINETRIRPIISDNDFFTIKKSFANAAAFEESIITAMSEYRGSGMPTMYIDPTVLSAIKLLKGEDGRYLSGSVPTDSELASRWGLSKIVPTTFMVGKGALVVNLRDYTVGATKGGQITNFDDFDIDFNQYKYLQETRLCGCLTLPKSAIHFNPTNAGTGADNTKAGLTYGQRQADKVVTPAGE